MGAFVCDVRWPEMCGQREQMWVNHENCMAEIMLLAPGWKGRFLQPRSSLPAVLLPLATSLPVAPPHRLRWAECRSQKNSCDRACLRGFAVVPTALPICLQVCCGIRWHTT